MVEVARESGEEVEKGRDEFSLSGANTGYSSTLRPSRRQSGFVSVVLST